MNRFTLGFAAVMMVTFVAGIVRLPARDSADLLLPHLELIVFIPALCSWVTARLIHLVRPRRAFDAADRFPSFLPAMGGLAGVLAIFSIGIQTAYLTDPSPGLTFGQPSSIDLPEWLITLSSSIVSTAIVVLVGCRKRKPGCCLRCGYDITHSLVAGRCPECGSIFAPQAQTDHSTLKSEPARRNFSRAAAEAAGDVYPPACLHACKLTNE